jgi:hypothetical protein
VSIPCRDAHHVSNTIFYYKRLFYTEDGAWVKNLEDKGFKCEKAQKDE